MKIKASSLKYIHQPSKTSEQYKDEIKLLEEAEHGRFNVVRKELNRNEKNYDINFVDYQGFTILHYAFKFNNDAMVQFLLGNKNLKLNDCLYHVIKSNEISYVKLILEPKGKYEKEIMFRECKGSLHFPGYLTPLMLASHCGHFEIMQYLIKENHPPIPVPHEPKCVCKKCVTELREMDPLEWAAKKLDTFRALTSPYYIMLDSEDPIFTVFLRVEEIKLWKNACWEFRRGFEELMKETETFAADLVSLCRTGREVITLLSEKEGCDWIGEDFKFPRLLMAVDKKQHLFVAQTNVQAVLEDAWVGNWYMWKTCADSKCLLFFFGRIFTLPLVCLLCLVPALNSKWSNFYDIPVNRMITSVASYLVFLFLLYLASDRDKTGQTRYEIQNHTLWQVIIFFFVVAHICSSFRLWTVQGTRRFFSFMWNTYDLFTQLMFAMTFAFWMCALLTLETMPDLERKYWHYLDPQLLAEGLFCIGTVLAYLRLLLLVQMHNTLGPMQISMGKMTKDFSKFIIIFGIVVVSFNVAMSRLYEYYDGMKQIDPKTGAESVQESSFVSFQDTFKVLFWGLFTMSSQEAADVVIENLPDVGEHLESVNSHDLTQAVGYGLFGVYEVLTVIVIMNMLIAAMSNTYQNVTDNVDVQWIFGRTEVYMIYMSQTAVPPPFSIVPAVGKIFYVYYQRLFSKQSPTSIKQPEDEENQKGIVDESYNDLMKKLVKRYLNLKK